MTANNSKFYLGYLYNLVGEYNSTYRRSIGKAHANADYSALTEEIESSRKAPRFKVSQDY